MREERAAFVNMGGYIDPLEYKVKVFRARTSTHV
jgi:hypothetical protein